MYRGLGDGNFSEPKGSKGSLAGSILAKFSLGGGSHSKPSTSAVHIDDQSLLARKDSEEVSDLENIEVSYL